MTKMRDATSTAASLLAVPLAMGLDLLSWDGARVMRGGYVIPVWTAPLVIAITYPILLLRWRHPRRVFVVIWTLSLSGLVLTSYEPFAGMLVALHALARTSSTRTARLALGVSLVPLFVDGLNDSTTSPNGPVLGFFVPFLLWTVLAVTVWAFGRRSQQAEQRSDQVQQLRAAQDAAAVREEQRALAHEFHDRVANSITAMLLQAAAARTFLDDGDRLARTLQNIDDAGVEAMIELHRLLAVMREEGATLRPTPTADLRDVGAILEGFRRTGLQIIETGDAVAAGTVGAEASVATTQALRECLTNASKHAGLGTTVTVRWTWTPSSLILTIHNTLDAASRALPAELSSKQGIAGVARRMTAIGGEFSAGHSADGFTARLEIPGRSRQTVDASTEVYR